MPLASNLQIAQLTVLGVIHQQTYRNVIHFGTISTEFDTNGLQLLTQLCNEFDGAFRDNFLPQVSNEFTYGGVRAKRVAPGTSDEVELLTNAGPGGAAQQALPSHCSMRLHKRSGKGGRKGRGSLHLPPPREDQVALSRLTAAGIAVVQSLIDDLVPIFIGAAGSSVWEIGVLQLTYSTPTPPAKPVITDRNWHPSATLAVDDVVGRQGRRRIGRGV